MKKDTYPMLEQRPIQSLKPHPDGVRSHNPSSSHLLGLSWQQFGYLRPPFVVNDATGSLIDGDQFLEGLRARLTPEALVPVWVVWVDEKLEDAAHLALQNHAGEWVWQRVSEHLKAAQASGVDPKLTGFHDYDIGPLVAADWAPPAKGPLDGSDAAQIGLL